MNGFEYLRSEGRKEVLAALEPYLQHTWECIMEKSRQAGEWARLVDTPKVDHNQFKCTCGLDEILERIRSTT
jgi:hypothetical protein